jgi:DNA modification methylase
MKAEAQPMCDVNRDSGLATANGCCLRRFVRGHNHVTLYLGDCLEIAPTLQGVDAVITDPPYGIKYSSPKSRPESARLKHATTMAQINRNAGASTIGDDHPFDPAPWLEYPVIAMWGADKFKTKLPEGGALLVWDKHCGRGPNDTNCDAEFAWVNTTVPRNVYRHVWKGLFKERGGEDEYGLRGCNTPRLHVAQKPVSLMTWVLEKAKVPDGATVLDPYMGSGSTGIACLRTGRNFVGIEIDPNHFKTACARLEAECNQGAFDMTPNNPS